MSAEFRKKLRNWLTSMLLLCFCVVMPLNAYWFFNDLTSWFVDRPMIFNYAGPFGEIFYVYAIGFVPIAIWHCCDVLQRGRPAGTLARALSSSALFHFALLMAGVILGLSATGWFTYIAPCGSTLRILMQDCYFTVLAFGIPQAIFLYSVLILCFCKVIISFRSRFKKAA